MISAIRAFIRGPFVFSRAIKPVVVLLSSPPVFNRACCALAAITLISNDVIYRQNLELKAEGVLASNEMHEQINKKAKEMGIKNKINVVICENNLNSVIGFDHRLSKPTLVLNSETPSEFIIRSGLAHVKFNSALGQNVDFMASDWTMCLIAYGFIFAELRALGSCGVLLCGAKILGRMCEKNQAKKADYLAIQYCSKEDIREAIRKFEKDQDYHKNIRRKKPWKMIKINKDGDVRYMFGQNPYATKRIAYLREAEEL